VLILSVMLYLPISRGWLLSRNAQHVYLGCAVLTLALIATLVGVRLAMPAAGATALNRQARSVLRLLLLPEILGSGLLWVAMWYFWFSFDRSHYLKKAGSFILLFFLAPFGTLIYYFLAYRQSVALRSVDELDHEKQQVPREVTS